VLVKYNVETVGLHLKILTFLIHLYLVTFFYCFITIYVLGRGEAYTRFWWGNLKERVNLGDPGVDGRLMLRWIFRK